MNVEYVALAGLTGGKRNRASRARDGKIISGSFVITRIRMPIPAIPSMMKGANSGREKSDER